MLAYKQEFTKFLTELGFAIDEARKVTGTQIEYWSNTLTEIRSLSEDSKEWVENPMVKIYAKRLLGQWKSVAKQYSDCSAQVSSTRDPFSNLLPLLRLPKHAASWMHISS